MHQGVRFNMGRHIVQGLLVLRISIWKLPCHSYMIKCPYETIFLHCLLTSSKSISVNRGSVWFNLMLEKISKLSLKLRSCTIFCCPGCRGWCRIASWSGCELWIQPHVCKHLTNTLFHILTESLETFRKTENVRIKKNTLIETISLHLLMQATTNIIHHLKVNSHILVSVYEI